ncbi:MAG: tetratricopeptide repeat protein [Bacteroidaceae bacterium]|nr:tetratricopeptide repeat protein [Candidatus Minthousia equi]MCQ2246109.1 tetratricopeptide repeat protein [Bacteroidaceae bacterium]
MAKKEKKQEEVELTQVVNKSEAFVTKYKWVLLGGIVALIAVVFGITQCQRSNENKENEASAAVRGAVEALAQGDYEKALNGDSIHMGLLKAMDQYSGTNQGDLAKVMAGEAYAQMGKCKEAIPLLEGFSKGDQMVSPAIKGLLGECYANVGEIDKAINAFKEAAKMADNNTISPRYLIEAGIMLESQKKADEALKLYQEVKTKYVNSPYYQEVDKYIERLSK